MPPLYRFSAKRRSGGRSSKSAILIRMTIPIPKTTGGRFRIPRITQPRNPSPAIYTKDIPRLISTFMLFFTACIGCVHLRTGLFKFIIILMINEKVRKTKAPGIMYTRDNKSALRKNIRMIISIRKTGK